MRSAAPWTNPTLMLSLLEDVDALGAEATGAFVLGDERQPLGVVFVQHARICWAVSSRMGGRLTDLLLSAGKGSLDRAALEGIYQECRAAGAPLGDTLVQRGLVSAAAVREALLVHTCEALISCGEDARRRWRFRLHSEPSYDAANTFSAAEILTALAQVQCPEVAMRARSSLARHVPETAIGVVFVRDGGGVPIALRQCSLSAADLLELGRWTASTVDVADALDPGAMVMLRSGGETTVVWKHDALLHLAACHDESDLAFVVATHARRDGSR